MYQIEIIEASSSGEPVSSADMSLYLRLNDDYESDLIADYVTTARILWENYTMRPVHSTVFCQHVYDFTSPIYLMRAGVTSIDEIGYYDSTGTLQTLEDYQVDISGNPAVVWATSYPSVSAIRRPTAYVEFTAGWNSDEVPAPVRTGIKLVAAHLYANREAYTESTLKELPLGFRHLADQYRLGMLNDMSGTTATYGTVWRAY